MSPFKPILIEKGFLNDAVSLINDFNDKKTYDLEEFINLWKERRFSLNLIERLRLRENVNYLSDCFRLTVELLEPNLEIYTKIAIFYLLHGMYMKQQCAPKLKIRMVGGKFKLVHDVYSIAKQNNWSCVVEVLRRMIQNNAFAIVANSRLRGPLTNKPNVAAQSLIFREDPKNTDGEVLETFDTLNLDHASYLQAKQSGILYYQAKNVLSASDRGNLCLIKETNEYNEFSREGKDIEGKSKIAESPSTSSKKGSIGARRAQLKSTAYSKSIGLSDSDSTDNESLASRLKKLKKSKKYSAAKSSSSNQDDPHHEDETIKIKKKRRSRRRRIYYYE